MIRRTLTALAVTLALLTPTAPAHADSPRGVTWGEFQKVHRGMTRWHVANLFDVRGHVLPGDPGPRRQVISYRLVPSERPGHATVWYRKRDGVWRATSAWWCQGEPTECRPGW